MHIYIVRFSYIFQETIKKINFSKIICFLRIAYEQAIRIHTYVYVLTSEYSKLYVMYMNSLSKKKSLYRKKVLKM